MPLPLRSTVTTSRYSTSPSSTTTKSPLKVRLNQNQKMAEQNYYTNPAFCQQSEFNIIPQRALSPQRHIRQPPVGAQTPLRILDTSMNVDGDEYEEQEFYEEMLVDGTGLVKENKVVVVAQKNDGKKYIQDYGVRYETNKIKNHRYEYIPMQDKEIVSPSKKTKYEEQQIEVAPGRIHRYAVIQPDEETELTSRNAKYALVPVEELNALVPQTRMNHRYDYIPEPSRYEYIQTTPQKPMVVPKRAGNPIATQKLHELLSTPKKSPQQQMLSPQSMRKMVPSQLSPIPKTPRPPKAQQKLNYAIGTRQHQQVPLDKRHTAIVAPMCSSPIQSVYSETTFSKSDSWMNSSTIRKAPVQATLALAAFMMLLCGGVTTGLCFYMISIMGRLYYLDFSIVAGFTCLVLGLLGFRTRNCYWLPNRNYISGYLVLSVFSLLTCAGLLVLLVLQPRPGTPLADMTSGAVCGISVLSLILAATGVVSSYCCKYPPPDNRVQHCAQGFSV